MSVDKRIRDALLPLGLPVENSVYQGTAKSYFVFNYQSLGADFGDDGPAHERFLVQVHLFAPLGENVTGRVREAKRALCAAGFTWPEVTNADDADGRHRVLECELAEGVECDGQV